MSEHADRVSRREDGVWLAVLAGLTVLYQLVLGWQGWMRLPAVAVACASTVVLMFAAGFARGFLRDTWPAVPPGLADKVVRLQAAGWRLARVHPWWRCGEERPHTHLVMPAAADEGRELVMIWDGTTVLDEHGNVVSREP